jgi:hypothetical protein
MAKPTLDAHVEAPADTPPVADKIPAVEVAAPEAVAVQAPVEEHPQLDPWQHEPRVALIYTGGEPKVYMPLRELKNGDVIAVPQSLVERYLATDDFAVMA